MRTHRWILGGFVQGVGFRPFVWRLANELGLNGSVRNVGGSVEIVATDQPGVDTFVQRVLTNHPPSARPELLAYEDGVALTLFGFHILPSEAGAAQTASLLPDQSVCEHCLAELADPSSRRYGYPFITCSQCGPRYTIMAAMPFDRATTSMANFPLCVGCQEEYGCPTDRRFHAQTMACGKCGPQLSYRANGQTVGGNGAALAATVAALADGAIVAVKGIGGYHLLCDAADDAAVCRLRLRKRRPTKPLAVLFARAGPDGLATLREYCAPNMEEARCLLAPERPIVLVRQRPGSGLSTALAPGLAELGAMLPYAPLHDLIADAFVTPLVATSGNISGEPVLTNAAEAEQCLGSIADAFLHHDRTILRPADDSVIRVTAGRGRPFRLGRGSAPLELTLPQELASPVLALGGQTKASLALGFGRRVVISPHLGEGGSPRGRDLLEATANSLQRLCGVQASAVICDAHSGFTSARWARTLPGMEVVPVWHHHAHAAAVAGEYPAEARWLCFTWDGVGLGEDGTLWGGEGLLGRPGAWTRVGSFRPFTPIGGEAVAREPWRAAAALAWEIGMDWHPHEGLFDAPLAQAAWRARNNAPPTSSVGRLFDAASAFLGLVQRARHEGEGPMALEAATGTLGDTLAMWEDAETLPLLHRPDGVWQADWAPLVARLLDQTRATATRAALFHASLARTLVAQANAARQVHGAFSVGLSGGVFQNRLLAELSLHGLAASGFRSYLPLKIPCNDGGLSFGQVVEAAARRRAA